MRATGNMAVSKRAIRWDKETQTHTFTVSVDVGHRLGTRTMAVRVLDSAKREWTEWSSALNVEVVAHERANLTKDKPAHRRKILNPNLPANFFRGKLKELKERKLVGGSIFKFPRSLSADSHAGYPQHPTTQESAAAVYPKHHSKKDVLGIYHEHKLFQVGSLAPRPSPRVQPG